MLQIPQSAQPAMRTVNDIDAQCALCVCLCVCVGVSASASQVKVTKKYVCVYVNDPPTCCPRLPLFVSPSLPLSLLHAVSFSVSLFSLQCELLCCGVFKNPFDIIWVGCPSPLHRSLTPSRGPHQSLPVACSLLYCAANRISIMNSSHLLSS